MEHARRKLETEVWEEWDRKMERCKKYWEKVIRFDTVTGPIFMIAFAFIGLVISPIIALLIKFL